MKIIDNQSVSATNDFILYSGAVNSVVSYITRKKSDFRFLNYYLELLVRKRQTERFTIRDYTVIFSLLYNGAEPMSDCVMNKRRTILDLVLKINDEYLIKLFLPFLKYFDDPNVNPIQIFPEETHLGRNAVLAAVAYQSMVLVQLALEGCFYHNIERSFAFNNTPLHIAASLPRVDITRYLLDKCGGYEETNIYLETPLFIAVKNNQIEQAIILLQYGADIRKRDSGGSTVLHVLCYREDGIYLEMFKFLLDVGCDPNSVCTCGWTPLHLLAMNQNAPNALECAKLLVQRGADINLKSVSGNTVVHTIADYCEDYTPLLDFLLRSGPDLNIVNFQDRTFLDVFLLEMFLPRRRNMLKNLILLDYTGGFKFATNPITYIWFDLFFEHYCRKELLLLESCKVAEFLTEPEYSLIRILNSNEKQISKLCKDPNLRSIMSKIDELECPIYGCDLKKKFESGLRLFLEEEKTFEFFTEVSNAVLDNDSMVEIMGYISPKDFEKFEKCLSPEHINELVKKGKRKPIEKQKFKRKEKVERAKLRIRKIKIVTKRIKEVRTIKLRKT